MAKTTISVQEDTLERFNEMKSDVSEAEPGMPDLSADLFLKSLMDTWDKVDEVGYGDTEDVALGDGYGEIAERIGASMDFPTADVKEAVRDVLREELPG